MLYGIDISSNQGKIDFNRVKNAGVEFIVIRTTTKNQNPDVRLGEYVKGCCEFEIPFAFYKYMYALSPDGARTEAKSVVSALNTIGVLPSKSIVLVKNNILCILGISRGLFSLKFCNLFILL